MKLICIKDYYASFRHNPDAKIFSVGDVLILADASGFLNATDYNIYFKELEEDDDLDYEKDFDE